MGLPLKLSVEFNVAAAAFCAATPSARSEVLPLIPDTSAEAIVWRVSVDNTV